ncbi:MAG: ATP-dependent metallopeptidase FtsH/Yme1/Tma family protein [Alphaproteobacteria bacterium]|nr:ATP-dependent metallopeptidase FtsH/Yme1/Tma family protein [Alphaproteobacteria bacterium]
MQNNTRNIVVWVVIIFFAILIGQTLLGGLDPRQRQEVAFSDFLRDVEKGEVRAVQIEGKNVLSEYGNGSVFTTYAPDYPQLVDTLRKNNVNIKAVPTEKTGFLYSLLSAWPIFLLIGFWWFMMRSMNARGGGGGAMGFGKSRARLLTEHSGKVLFDDVAGIDEAKEELGEIVDFLRDPSKFQRLGGKIPRGCLLVGPPGTGKTLLARAIAGEAGVPFFSISGSDFVEMFVGVGASRVRDMFEQGKKNAPCIIFIDEIDAVGRSRGAGLGGGNDEREQTLNQLLVEMDGFEANESVIIIAATNRPDVLDQALLRPGRFDRQIVVGNPDIAGRAKILEVHLRKVPKGPDIDARVIARGTPGFSGADLANLVNEAALLAARKSKKVVTMKDLEEAKDKVMMGAERKSMVMSDKEKRLTAYHEGGHAIVSLHMPACDPIHKATIIPRGRALGMVMSLPESDKVSVTRQKMQSDLAMTMGGRVAEELIFGYDQVTSGASSDIQYATRLAKAMVTQWGMSDAVGPVFHGDEQQEVFIGQSMSRGSTSASSQAVIDAEVKRIIDEAYKTATKTLQDNRHELEILAEGLLEYETLTGEEIKALIRGEPPHRDPEEAAAKPVKKSTIPSRRKAGEEGEEGDAEAEKAEKPAKPAKVEEKPKKKSILPSTRKKAEKKDEE